MHGSRNRVRHAALFRPVRSSSLAPGEPLFFRSGRRSAARGAKTMTNIRSAILGAVFSVAAAASAQALNSRTWISGAGTDQAGCGPIATPCRTLQYAHDNTTAGGEIDVKDAAGYGSLTITKAINVVNDGVGVAGVLAASGQNAITINAGLTDDVVLRGLTIEGSKLGANGVVFNQAGSLNIANCVVQNFTGNDNTHGNGILIQHTAGTPNIVVTNTNVSNNDYIGFSIIPGGSGGGIFAVDRLVATKNKLGFAMYTRNTSGVLTESVSNSIAANNVVTGFQIIGSTTFLDNVSAYQNADGIYVECQSAACFTLVGINRSVSANNTKYDLETVGNIMTIESYSNNAINSFHMEYPARLAHATPF